MDVLKVAVHTGSIATVALVIIWLIVDKLVTPALLDNISTQVQIALIAGLVCLVVVIAIIAHLARNRTDGKNPTTVVTKNDVRGDLVVGNKNSVKR